MLVQINGVPSVGTPSYAILILIILWPLNLSPIVLCPGYPDFYKTASAEKLEIV